MGKILNFFKKLSFKKPKDEDSNIDAEELRLSFKHRYHNFKLLLSANNKALEIMSNIEKALNGHEPFGISFVKTNCIAVSVNLFRLIRNIDELAPGKYKELYSRFDEIQKSIATILNQRKIQSDERLVIPLSDVVREMADIVGSKMANIGEIKNRIKLTVPPGFVITSYSYEKFIEHNDLQPEIDRLFTTSDIGDVQELYSLSQEIQKLIMNSELPEKLEQEMSYYMSILENEAGENVKIAMRSSALGEDSAGSSFAGQYHSELNVSRSKMFEIYKKVIASKYSLQAITYRLNKGFRDEDILMSVGCLAMVTAETGGVIYSRNPVNIFDDSIFINSTWGLPKAVVDGSISSDLFIVERKKSLTISHKDIRIKEKQFVCNEEGVCKIDLIDEKKDVPSLTDEQILALSDIAVNLEYYYSSPQDIEWAIDSKGKIYLLQCRPLQQMEYKEQEQINNLEDDLKTVIARGGITASPGAASGSVYIISGWTNALSFPKGSIIITKQALPSWAPLLNQAAAIVTEEGSFAGHLANVAREFRVPALFGVQKITEMVSNGEIITVDANRLIIHRGRLEELLVEIPKKENPIDNSPVYEILKQVSEFIVPLNLLNPDSQEFKPANCKTYHDITRFAHEKSVHEMFVFGKEHNFSERSSKQLYYKVPMQWWILNLDDGFKEEVKGKYVYMENIASIPMLSLWEGIIAIPWDGPPPIDGKGLVSVMFQATANTALTTGTVSKYSDRNYFMISKNYCSLSSRLGFHFSVLEALVSERKNENYISFQFKGGAADHERRIKRVLFVGDILENYEFRIKSKEDALFARLEGFDEEKMKDKLKIIGYLIIHTRQLDMIMTNSAKVSYYRSKIIKDIDDIILSKK